MRDERPVSDRVTCAIRGVDEDESETRRTGASSADVDREDTPGPAVHGGRSVVRPMSARSGNGIGVSET